MSRQVKKAPDICSIILKHTVMDNNLIRNPSTDTTSTNMVLAGAVLMANFDYTSLTEYAVKAVVGSIIWMGFKLATDYFSERIKNKKDKK